MIEINTHLKFTDKDDIALPPLGSAEQGEVFHLSEQDIAAIVFSCAFAKSALVDMHWKYHLAHYGPAIDSVFKKLGVKIQ